MATQVLLHGPTHDITYTMPGDGMGYRVSGDGAVWVHPWHVAIMETFGFTEAGLELVTPEETPADPVGELSFTEESEETHTEKQPETDPPTDPPVDTPPIVAPGPIAESSDTSGGFVETP